jgi:hypothetical protein
MPCFTFKDDDLSPPLVEPNYQLIELASKGRYQPDYQLIDFILKTRAGTNQIQV